MGSKSKSSQSSSTQYSTTNTNDIKTSNMTLDGDGTAVNVQDVSGSVAITTTDHDAVEAAKEITLQALARTSETFNNAIRANERVFMPSDKTEDKNAIIYSSGMIIALAAVLALRGK